MNNLLNYGIAVNMFGNYAQEGRALNDITDRVHTSMNRLQNLVIGGGITAVLYKFSNSILNTAKMMEQNFATLASSLGSYAKASENLEWARQKGASTPFGIEEVNSAVSMMTSMGFNKDDKMREEVFNSIGDFAGAKGAGFADMMQRVAKATFGNWESLGDTYGVRRQNIGTMAREQMSRTPEKYAGEEQAIAKAIQMVEKGKSGTEEYRMAVVKLIGVLGRDGMAGRLKTIEGAMANIDDIFQNFMFNMVGYSQVQGTLANTIKDTIVEKILNPLSEAHVNNYSALKETTTSVDQLGRIGKAVGEVFISLWGGISDGIGSMVGNVSDWIDKMDVFFSDFQNNVAPLILFLFLVRLEVEIFLSGFVSGFKFAFNFFITAIGAVYKAFATFIGWLGISENATDALGKTVGLALGIMIGMKMFRFATQPFAPLVTGAKYLYLELLKVFSAQRAVLLADGEMAGLNGMKQVLKTFQYLLLPLQGVAISAWSFTTAMLANPISWIVIAVIALVAWVAYLVTHWDEFRASMQDTSDIVIALATVFLPILGVPMLLAKYWEEFSTIFSNIWRGISGYLGSFWLRIKFGIIEPLKINMVAMFVLITGAGLKFMNMLVDKFPVLRGVFQTFKIVLMSIKVIFVEIWNYLSQIVNKVTNSDFIKGILSIGEAVSGWFGDSGEKAYEDDLKKYDPEAYYKMLSEKNNKILTSKPAGGTSNTTTKEADTKNSYNFTGSTFMMPNVATSSDFYGELSTVTKSTGR